MSTRRAWGGTAVLSVALLAAAVSLVVVAARGPAPASALQDRVRAIASTLRCPVCQDLSVADSPSALAEEMRTTIAEKLQAGETPDQIRAGFVGAYGQWILLAPTHSGLNLVAWIAPVLLLVGGLLLAVTSVRRWSAGSAGREVREPDPTRQESGSGLTRDDRMILDRAILRVRDEPD